MRNEMKTSNATIQMKKETTMKMTTFVKASVFAATLAFVCMLPPAAQAQADSMPNPDEYPFSASEVPAAQPVQLASAKVAKADFQGKVSLPFDVKCGDKNLKAGQYLLSVKSEGSTQVVTIHGRGDTMKMRVHEVSANSDASQSALLVRKSSQGHRLEAVYVEGLNATLYLNTNPDGAHARMERLPIS
jgi:hypothetical protein